MLISRNCDGTYDVRVIRKNVRWRCDHLGVNWIIDINTNFPSIYSNKEVKNLTTTCRNITKTLQPAISLLNSGFNDNYWFDLK